MDLDRPLDELISDKRKATRTERAERTDRTERPRAPRQSSDRRAPVPYARPPPRSTDEKWVHDAYSGPGAQRGRARDGGGLSTTSVAGTGAGFTGVSPRIEVTGLHYEVTTADLKTIFSQAGTLVQGPTIRLDDTSPHSTPV
ncbi:hypothetical protein EHS25_009780 [Saitozyma podzolica]|uniref:RRM domain-containing protein n=1 Tax=Saitozyma podzolica TaxID=1890683 RepID=A0A427YK90_9TREE|nr:hypothetical protein EHS25_009780 [Saitozyma podzolica]